MAASITIDMTEFSRQAQRLVVLTRKEGRDIIRQSAKQLVNDCAHITPPFEAPITEATYKASFGSQRKVGMSAIKGDLFGGARGWRGKTKRAGIFRGIPKALMRYAEQNQAKYGTAYWVTKAGVVYGTESHLFNPSGNHADMREHHRRYFKNGRMTGAGGRTRDVGRWKWVDKMVVPDPAMKRYLRHLWNQIGKAKSGWVLAASSLGLKLPLWIAKHKGQGLFRDSGSKRWPEITVGNLVPWIQQTGANIGIIRLAIHNRTDRLRKDVEKKLAILAAKANRGALR